jgi:hypothetical protein
LALAAGIAAEARRKELAAAAEEEEARLSAARAALANVQDEGLRMSEDRARILAERREAEQALRAVAARASEVSASLVSMTARRDLLAREVEGLGAAAPAALAAVEAAERRLSDLRAQERSASERVRAAEDLARSREMSAADLRATLAALERAKTQEAEELRRLSARQAELRRALPALERRAAAAEAAARRQERLAAEVAALEGRRAAARPASPGPAQAAAHPTAPHDGGLRPVEAREAVERITPTPEGEAGMRAAVPRDPAFPADEPAASGRQAHQAAAAAMGAPMPTGLLPALPLAGGPLLGLPPGIGVGQ